MEAKESTVITFRVSPEELQTIETEAAQAGMNRTDYVRSRVFAPDTSAKVAELEKELNLLTDQLGRMAEREEARMCNNLEHANEFGVGHCFICDLPINPEL
jgi:uncharacterized protein (DUF1778 family)